MSVIQGGSVIESVRSAGLALAPDAHVFTVDPSDSTYTLQNAIDDCVADRGDVILVQPGSHSVTSTVNFDTSGITVMASALGAAPAVAGEKFTVNADASFTDGPAATITAPCRIVGLGFAGRDTSQESLLIDCEEAGGFSGGFIQLENCRFSCWYGAMDAGIRAIGGAANYIVGCTFDGLFGGFGTAAIVLENDTGGFASAYTVVDGCRFSSIGSGQHAIAHATGAVPVGVNYVHNVMDAGFSTAGAFLDNNSVASTGLVADNWTGLADKATAFENLTNSSLVFADNHYDE